MLKEEALSMNKIIYGHSDYNNYFPLLNIGSQTREFREVNQPYIDKYIFQPAREKQLEVLHTDLQEDEGVDMAGDLCDPEFLNKLKGCKFKGIICSNLLEHVNRNMRIEICRAIEEVVDKGGYLIVTVPRSYPYHPDPIDTYYRPTPSELSANFTSCELMHSEIIYGGTYLKKLLSNPNQLLRNIARVFMPFYRPNRWLGVVHQFMWLFKCYSVSLVVLRKV